MAETPQIATLQQYGAQFRVILEDEVITKKNGILEYALTGKLREPMRKALSETTVKTIRKGDNIAVDLVLKDEAVVEGFHVNIVSEARLRKSNAWYSGFDCSLCFDEETSERTSWGVEPQQSTRSDLESSLQAEKKLAPEGLNTPRIKPERNPDSAPDLGREYALPRSRSASFERPGAEEQPSEPLGIQPPGEEMTDDPQRLGLDEIEQSQHQQEALEAAESTEGTLLKRVTATAESHPSKKIRQWKK
ncbi:hypothetical protein TGAM01_v210400 [Trichoderma gamsii]|uniref:Uncharacterized protein n=1 Tax=Trichoderma gamsii TaxID=398673 RepID=A0A2P4Z8T9_9HYPO|nr:hypothetical protein TGAM01_v210400 [Trichoderma gamsii]PON20710.1 hypothetical protein TGAM01_v210400 [Trichoderma gamsii]